MSQTTPQTMWRLKTILWYDGATVLNKPRVFEQLDSAGLPRLLNGARIINEIDTQISTVLHLRHFQSILLQKSVYLNKESK